MRASHRMAAAVSCSRTLWHAALAPGPANRATSDSSVASSLLLHCICRAVLCTAENSRTVRVLGAIATVHCAGQVCTRTVPPLSLQDPRSRALVVRSNLHDFYGSDGTDAEVPFKSVGQSVASELRCLSCSRCLKQGPRRRGQCTLATGGWVLGNCANAYSLRWSAACGPAEVAAISENAAPPPARQGIVQHRLLLQKGPVRGVDRMGRRPRRSGLQPSSRCPLAAAKPWRDARPLCSSAGAADTRFPIPSTAPPSPHNLTLQAAAGLHVGDRRRGAAPIPGGRAGGSPLSYNLSFPSFIPLGPRIFS